MLVPKSLQNLITEFEKLPTIGSKSASRLAFALINSGRGKDLSLAIDSACKNLRYCTICFNISDEDVCEVCKSNARNKHKICIVEDSLDVIAIERMNHFDGVYHVLGGLVSPMDDVTNIRLSELIGRVNELTLTDSVELIIAINQSIEGEITLMYIKDYIAVANAPLSVTITKLASGLPTGADIEYADQMTLSHAFDARLKV